MSLFRIKAVSLLIKKKEQFMSKNNEPNIILHPTKVKELQNVER